MERLLKWLDDWDDLLVLFRNAAPGMVLTVALVVVFVAALGAMLLLGPPDLLAAP
jgi:predicted RND superfamily exporter protein